MRALLLPALAGVAACGGEAYVAVEPVKGAADVRVFVTLTPTRNAAVALPGSTPFRLDLDEVFGRGESVQVWLFHYSRASIEAAYPELAGKGLEELALLLAPAIEAGAAPQGMPEPAQVLAGVLEQGRSGDVVLGERQWADWLAGVGAGSHPAFGFHPPAPPAADPCEGFTAERVSAPDDVQFLTVAVGSDDVAMISGKRDNGSDAVFARVEGTRAIVLPDIPTLTAFTGELEHDGQGGFWGISGSLHAGTSKLFRIDAMGRRFSVPSIPLQGTKGLSIGVDGYGIVFGDGEIRELVTGSTVAPRRTDFPGLPKLVSVARRGSIVISDGLAFHHYEAGQWSQEHALTLFEQIQTIGGDGEAWAAGGDGGLVLLRDPATRQWARPNPELNRGNIVREVVGARGGRILIAGARSTLALWHGSGWCEARLGLDTSFRALAISPSGRVAYAVGTEDVSRAGHVRAVFRVTVPPPPR